MCTASDRKMGRAKARTAVGLVTCSQTGETTVSYTYNKPSNITPIIIIINLLLTDHDPVTSVQ